jgi:hypothetical protein
MLVEIFWRMGGGVKKSQDKFSTGEVPTRTPTHTQTLLRLRLYNLENGKWKMEIC